MHRAIALSQVFVLNLVIHGCGREEVRDQRLDVAEVEPQKIIDRQGSASINQQADQQNSDVISTTPAIADSQESAVITIPEAQPDTAPVTEAPVAAPFAGFTTYRIKILEMKQDCSGDTVNIEQIRLKENNEFLADTFRDYPDSPNPNFNSGRIGNYEATLTSSGDFDDFYPFEAFGGGFGAGWFSNRDSFQDNVSPAPAAQDVWLDISFGQTPVKLQSVYINGGSSKLNEFVGCAPSELEIFGTIDAGANWLSLAKSKVDTQNGAEILLSLPVQAIASRP